MSGPSGEGTISFCRGSVSINSIVPVGISDLIDFNLLIFCVCVVIRILVS